MDTRKYETVMLFRPDLTEESTERINTRLQDLIRDEEGSLLRVDDWGKRRTAYPVHKNSKAHFIQYTYAGRPGIVQRFERTLGMFDEVMKYHSLKLADFVSEEDLDKDTVFTNPPAESEAVKEEARRRDGPRGDRRERDSRHRRRVSEGPPASARADAPPAEEDAKSEEASKPEEAQAAPAAEAPAEAAPAEAAPAEAAPAAEETPKEAAAEAPSAEEKAPAKDEQSEQVAGKGEEE